MARKARIWLSRKSACGSPRASWTKRLKDMAPSSMKTVATHCTAGREAGEGVVVVGHAAGGDGGEAVRDGVEPGHPRPEVGERAGERQRQVDEADGDDDRLRLGHDLAQGVEVGAPQHLHAADVEDGQQDHGEQDDADAADPGHHAAPEERALRQVVDADDDGRAGGGERRGELEVGVGEVEVRGAEHERQAGEGGEDRPGAGGEQEALAEAEVDLAAVGAGERHRGADQHGEDGRPARRRGRCRRGWRGRRRRARASGRRGRGRASR